MGTTYGSSWQLEIDRQFVNITSQAPTPNESWRLTDSNGHEHYYDHGYPTLDLVIDAQHWCLGNEGFYAHDPHMAIDAWHYECKTCRQVIEPTMDPAGTPKNMPGLVTATLSGWRDRHMRIVMQLEPSEIASLKTMQSQAELDSAANRLLAECPDDRILSTEWRP